MPTYEEIETGAAGMYGKNWDNPDPEKRPGPKMKDIWRQYSAKCLKAVEALYDAKALEELTLINPTRVAPADEVDHENQSLQTSSSLPSHVATVKGRP